MDKKWFLIYTKLLSRPNELDTKQKTVLKVVPLEGMTKEEAMIEARKMWAAITWGESSKIRTHPCIAQLTNTISLFTSLFT